MVGQVVNNKYVAVLVVKKGLTDPFFCENIGWANAINRNKKYPFVIKPVEKGKQSSWFRGVFAPSDSAQKKHYEQNFAVHEIGSYVFSGYKIKLQ